MPERLGEAVTLGGAELTQRLAAILAADAAGYSRLMARDERATVATLDAARAVFRIQIESNFGRVVDTAGDSVLAVFQTATGAVRAALAIQGELQSLAGDVTEERRLHFRIGIHLGDVIEKGDGTVYGDGVNIAARLQNLANPGGVTVSESVRAAVLGKVPVGFADQGIQTVKNISEPIRAYSLVGDGSGKPRSASTGCDPSLPDKPSIAVLPFTNMSGEPEQEYFADGMAEDLITALSRLRWLFVIARNSTFAYKGRSVDVRQIARELGVRYVLEGSVRTAGQRIRITGQLIDAASGKHIWAEKYDRQLSDIFAVQDEITERAVAAIEPHLYAEEGVRVATRPPESIDVWGLVVRAIGLINRVGRKESEEARQLLRHAIELDPSYARAHATLSWAVWWAALCYWLPTDEGYEEAARYAETARLLDPGDPWARMTNGLCLSTAGQHEWALDELRACIDLNPSFALGRMALGWALLRSGRYEEAIAETGKALRMSPTDSFAGFYTVIHGLALLGARRFAEALPFLRASVAALAEYPGHYNTLISCCGHLGLLAEAQEFIVRRNRIGPPLRTSVLRHNLRNYAHRDVFVEGLIKAGVPE